MSLTWKSLALGIMTGLAAAFIISVVPTAWDWLENPGGIFHDSTGTRWHFVSETFLSWFWPSCLVTLPVCVLIQVAIAARKSADDS